MLPNVAKISCFLGLFLSIDAMYLVSNETRYVVYRNILTPEYRDQFVFSTFPSHSGDPKNVADGQDKYFSDKQREDGVIISRGRDYVSYIKVDLKKEFYVQAFAITGNPTGGSKPSEPYFLQGSNDGKRWKMVAEGDPKQWHARGTYPFREEQIVYAKYPDKYQYYRVITRGPHNSQLIIYNWGLFIP